jgi:hypothetical protein
VFLSSSHKFLGQNFLQHYYFFSLQARRTAGAGHQISIWMLQTYHCSSLPGLPAFFIAYLIVSCFVEALTISYCVLKGNEVLNVSEMFFLLVDVVT